MAKKKKKDPKKIFDEYWTTLKKDLASLAKTKDKKKKELLALQIEFKREEVMERLDRSAFSGKKTCG